MFYYSLAHVCSIMVKMFPCDDCRLHTCFQLFTIALAMPPSRKRKCASAAASDDSEDADSKSAVDDFASDDEGEDCSSTLYD